jgi:porin
MPLFHPPTASDAIAAAKHNRLKIIGRHLALVAVAAPLCSGGVIADEGNGDAKIGIPSPSIAPSLPSELGDQGGIRKALAERAVTFKLNYTGEILGNVAGGIQRAAVYDGQIEFVLNVDLEKRVGWKGASIHANVFQIQGEQLAVEKVGSLDTVSSIEALATIRLYEASFQQRLFDDKLSIKFGQLAADTEFLTSTTASHFVNGTFGFPTIDFVDLPSGGPAYPLATPGIRIQIDPLPSGSLLAAVFNGDPSGPGAGDPQARNRYGVNFRVSDPPLWIGEAQYKYNQEKGATDLPGVLKLGIWYHVGTFDDVGFGTDGQSLTFGNGIPTKRRGNWGVYGVVDQQIWRLSGKDPERAANVFVRVSGSPSDRNEIDFYVDGGVTFTGLVPRRPGDAFGVAFAYNRISGDLSALDKDEVAAGQRAVVHDYEALLELTYQAQIKPGWIVQPDFQYIWHPGGRAPVSDAPNAPAIPNAAILGIRTVVNY